MYECYGAEIQSNQHDYKFIPIMILCFTNCDLSKMLGKHVHAVVNRSEVMKLKYETESATLQMILLH